MSILVVGSVALDTVETPTDRADEVVGGAATYFAAAASFFDVVRVVAVEGEDFPRADVSFLEERGVDLAGLETAPGETFRWTGRYHEDFLQRDTLRTDLNVFETFHPKLPAAYKKSDIVFLANIDPPLQAEVLRQVERPRFRALDTMNLWIDIKRDELLEVLREVDLVFLNDEEARQLTGESNLVKAARRVTETGPTAAVVKKGEHGSLLSARGELYATPAFPLENVVDPTGAGDSFAGGFLGSLAAEPEIDVAALRRAAAYGTVLASFCVESFSVDRLRSLTVGDIRSRYGRMADFASAAPAGGWDGSRKGGRKPSGSSVSG